MFIFLPHCSFCSVHNVDSFFADLYSIMPDYVHPVLHKSILTLLAELELAPEDPPMQKVIPFPRYPVPAGYPLAHPSVSPVPPTLTFWTFPAHSMNEPSQKAKTTGHKPHLMGTLNATPDSFSDGSTHNTLHTALAYARGAVSAGASIIDVGGYSTRPGATFVEVEEEVERVVPIIRAMRQPSLPAEDEDGRDEGSVLQAEGAKKEDGLVGLWDMPISIDTFRWDVARAAILAGANCINDVYAFTGPDSYPYPPPRDNGKYAEESMGEMKRVAREFAVPVVLMHSRGDAAMNKDYGVYDYASVGRKIGGGAVIEGVQVELGQKVDHIIMGKGGVRRWFVIVDPGIGFSKSLEGNLEVLRGAKQITAHVDVGQGKFKEF
jgi:dihydroneopterin aldolase/2-amino-4-hydroxy-6-hydroxymethyldihydropteridine diphosphokinase/dihydropteroate synthase